MAAMLSAVPGCEDVFGSSPPAPKVDIAGMWTCADGPISTRYLFRADGKFTKSVSLPRAFPQQTAETGTWVLHEDLSLDITFLGGREEVRQVIVTGTKMSFAEGSQLFYRGR